MRRETPADKVARCADAYIMARFHGVGNAAKALDRLRAALNDWRPRMERERREKAA